MTSKPSHSGVKINQRLLTAPAGARLILAWLKSRGISGKLPNYCVTSGWLYRLGDGAYTLRPNLPEWQGAVLGLQQKGVSFHPGGRTAPVGRGKARQLAAVMEIGRRLITPLSDEPPVLNRPELIAAHMRPIAGGPEVEKFRVACLNRKNRLIKLVEVTSGMATSSLAHPREVFRAAIRHEATAVICIHKHPSGDPAPSAADVQVTRQPIDAAKIVDIELARPCHRGPAGPGLISWAWASTVSALQGSCEGLRPACNVNPDTLQMVVHEKQNMCCTFISFCLSNNYFVVVFHVK